MTWNMEGGCHVAQACCLAPQSITVGNSSSQYTATSAPIYRVTAWQGRTHRVCETVLRCASLTETMTCAANTAEKMSSDASRSKKATGLSLCSEMG